MRFTDESAIPTNNRIPLYLSRYRFTYVPAIKDKTFFSDLQGQMYDVLASVASQPLRQSAQNFEQQLQLQLQDLLGLLADYRNSAVSLPESLRQIFESLEISSDGIPLSRRGDGIKIRHIPKLLRFISMKQDEILSRGKVRYTHIWGFEEPENNVEMSSCFEMANELVSIIQSEANHQLFLTTHSPIFYRAGDNLPDQDQRLSTLFVQKISTNSEIIRKNPLVIDQEMGLMALVSPYVQEAKSQYDLIRTQLNFARNQAQHRIPTLFVEGDTDKDVIECAFAQFRTLHGQIDIFSGGTDYGSANALSSRALAWVLTMRHRATNQRTKAVALFDQDESGSAARVKLTDDLQKLGIPNDAKLKILQLPASQICRGLRARGFLLPVDLESVFTDEIWTLADERGWLEPRSNLEDLIRDDLVRRMFADNRNPLHELADTEKMRMTKTFTNDGKQAVTRHVLRLEPAAQATALAGFRPLIQQLETYLLG